MSVVHGAVEIPDPQVRKSMANFFSKAYVYGPFWRPQECVLKTSSFVRYIVC